jgi:hypothetical protein
MEISVEELKDMNIPLRRICFSLADMNKFRQTGGAAIEHISRKIVSENISLFTRMKRAKMLPSWFVLDTEFDDAKEYENVNHLAFRLLYEGNFVGHPSLYHCIKNFSLPEKAALSLHMFREGMGLQSGMSAADNTLLDSWLIGCPGLIVGDVLTGVYSKNIKIAYNKLMSYISSTSCLKVVEPIEEEVIMTVTRTYASETELIIPVKEVERTTEITGILHTSCFENPNGLTMIVGLDIAKDQRFFNLQEQMEFPKQSEIDAHLREMDREREEERLNPPVNREHEQSERDHYYDFQPTPGPSERYKMLSMLSYGDDTVHREPIIPKYYTVTYDNLTQELWAKILGYIRPLARFSYRKVSKLFYNATFCSCLYIKIRFLTDIETCFEIKYCRISVFRHDYQIVR